MAASPYQVFKDSCHWAEDIVSLSEVDSDPLPKWVCLGGFLFFIFIFLQPALWDFLGCPPIHPLRRDVCLKQTGIGMGL